MLQSTHFPLVGTMASVPSFFVFVFVCIYGCVASTPRFPKRGTSGLSGAACSDAAALHLKDTWTYNWGVAPDGEFPPCTPPNANEFVPMIWGCWAATHAAPNCTFAVTDAVRASWSANGVTHLLGFNEPDNPGQSNLAPAAAARFWGELDAFASSASPPLQLVGPGMTHWDESGGSPWLDQFLGNLSTAVAGRIVAFAQHDYSGNADGIVARAAALHKKYNRKVWLTEFAVGSGKDRAANDAFAQKVLPLLDASDAVERYAWFSARNAPAAWVNESSLLVPFQPPPGSWTKASGHACAPDEMQWLSRQGSKAGCLAHAVDNHECALPKTAIYQSGTPKNCYCANSSRCTKVASAWQDLYTQHSALLQWPKKEGEACAANAMLWLGQHESVLGCETMAIATPACTYAAGVKEVFYESGDVQNCYCANTTSTCASIASPWLARYTQPAPPPPPTTPTSTGIIYTPA